MEGVFIMTTKWHVFRKPGLELIGIGLVFTVAYLVLKRLPFFQEHGYGVELLFHVIVSLVLTACTTGLLLWRNVDIILAVLIAKEEHDIGNHGPLSVMYKNSVFYALKRIGALKSEQGVQVINDDEISIIVQSCFDFKCDAYIAVDSNKPSQYNKLYPNYFEMHSAGMRKLQASWRILAVEKQTLIDDLREQPVVFKRFVQWHIDNRVPLGQVDPTEAANLADMQKLKTIDMGLWEGKCSILFFPGTSPEGPITLRYLSPTDPLYHSCKAYFALMLEAESEIALSGNETLIFRKRDESDKRSLLEAIG
jgi:hypothetical protein